MAPKKLFISYSHRDEALLKELLVHLRPLERREVIAPWFDGHILPGDDLDEKITEALNGADIVALLVSPDFLASDYCFNTELTSAIQRHEKGLARVIPIVVRDCQWKKTSIHRIKVLPKDGRSLTSMAWQYRDATWTSVAEGIEAAAILDSAVAASPTSSSSKVPASSPQSPAAMPLSRTRKITDKDRDDFKHQAFEKIAGRFDASINILSDGYSGKFRRIDANRFSAVIYADGAKKAACTIWIDGGSFGENSICYVEGVTSSSDSMHESLRVTVESGEIYLKPTMSFRHFENEQMDAAAASEYLWARFVERIARG